MFDNLKIAITDAVQLKAVCEVLGSMGYVKRATHTHSKYIETNESGIFDCFWVNYEINCNTTLTDLLAMRDKKIKEKIGA